MSNELRATYFNFNPLPTNVVYIYGAAANASKWQMGFNLAFKGLNSSYISWTSAFWLVVTKSSLDMTTHGSSVET
jgi:hypothetical protein